MQDQHGFSPYNPYADVRNESTDNMPRNYNDNGHAEMEKLMLNNQMQQPFDNSSGFSFNTNRLALFLLFHIAVLLFFLYRHNLIVHLLFIFILFYNIVRKNILLKENNIHSCRLEVHSIEDKSKRYN